MEKLLFKRYYVREKNKQTNTESHFDRETSTEHQPFTIPEYAYIPEFDDIAQPIISGESLVSSEDEATTHDISSSETESSSEDSENENLSESDSEDSSERESEEEIDSDEEEIVVIIILFMSNSPKKIFSHCKELCDISSLFCKKKINKTIR